MMGIRKTYSVDLSLSKRAPIGSINSTPYCEWQPSEQAIISFEIDCNRLILRTLSQLHFLSRWMHFYNQNIYHLFINKTMQPSVFQVVDLLECNENTSDGDD